MRRGVRGVLFDKDGTLFDFEASWGGFAREVIADLSGGDPALAGRLAAVLGFDPVSGRFAPRSIVIAETTRTVARHLAPCLPDPPEVEPLAQRLDAVAAATPQVPAADLVALFRRLRDAGLALGVATNDSEVSARRHLDHAEVSAWLDFVAGYDSGHGAKPGPGQALAFARHSGLDPAAIALVGDSAHDMEAARAAGMIPVAVLGSPAPGVAHLADHVLESVADLPAWLGL